MIILFWSVVLDALSYRFAWFRKLAKSGPRPLIKDGKLIRKTMRREFMTEGEVMTQLRVHGIEDPRQVHRAYLESNGDISILSHHDDDDARQTISYADRNNGGRKTD